ncbi:MAG: xylulose kinase [Candidatus Glassbacteria bacterium]|nr:xylulose kinase [Candidatus Glassbacteria bacterium]
MPHLALGLDSSTQSLSAAVIDIESRGRVCEITLDYLADERLGGFGIGEDYLLPPEEPGDARQPVAIYFASLDALCERLAGELKKHGLSPANISAINVSGQQHGHVMLSRRAEDVFGQLNADSPPRQTLADILSPAPAVAWARIWRTANTAAEAAAVTERAGGRKRIIELTGSDAPLRFSAFGIRKTALAHPEAYADTAIIHQISSLIPAVLTGQLSIALDWGNACGSSLMNYREKQWSPDLLAAVAADLPGGPDGLRERLPELASARTRAGRVARYFTAGYGFDQECIVGIGSGDNPQTKVLTGGTLLSLGTSFVIMAAAGSAESAIDSRGYANAMYDALDRPFCFGCRTNGALRWDGVRAMHGLGKRDYAAAESALAVTPAGNNGRLFIWRTEAESFPVAPPAGPLRIGYSEPELAADYSGIVESSLAGMYLNSRHIMSGEGELYLTGGPSASLPVLRRAAAIFGRRTVAVESGGAALGAAATAACLWLAKHEPEFDPGAWCSSLLERRAVVEPSREDIRAFHGDQGMLRRYRQSEADIS